MYTSDTLLERLNTRNKDYHIAVFTFSPTLQSNDYMPRLRFLLILPNQIHLDHTQDTND